MCEHQSLCLHVSAWPSVCPYISSCPSMPISRCKLITLTSMFIFMQVYMSRSLSLSLACILCVCANTTIANLNLCTHLSIYLLCPYIYLTIYLAICLSFDLYICPSIYLYVQLPRIHPAILPCIQTSVCLSVGIAGHSHV